MGDLLGAASLVATVIAILYSLWYPEINGAFNLERRDIRVDRSPAIETMGRAIRTKALPLAVVSLLPPIVFGPDVWGLLWRTLGSLTSTGDPRLSYDSIDAAFVVVWALLVILAVVAASQLKALWFQRLDFGKDP